MYAHIQWLVGLTLVMCTVLTTDDGVELGWATMSRSILVANLSACLLSIPTIFIFAIVWLLKTVPEIILIY